MYNTSSDMAKGALQGRANSSLTALEHVLEIQSTYLNDTGIYTCTSTVAAYGASYNDTDQGYMTVTGAYERRSYRKINQIIIIIIATITTIR